MIENEEDSEDNDQESSSISFCFNCRCNFHSTKYFTFPWSCSDDDNEIAKFSLMGRGEINHSKDKIDSKIMALPANIKRITYKNRNQSKLLQQFDEKECAYKESIATLKTRLKEGKRIE